MARLAAVLLAACTEIDLHAPDLGSPTCARVEVAAYTAGDDECITLRDANGLTLFRRAESESCGGPPCLRLEPGESALVLAKMSPGPEPEWQVERDACRLVTDCE